MTGQDPLPADDSRFVLLDILAVVVLALFLGLGAGRGVLAASSRLISMVLAYCVAFFASARFGPQVAERLQVSELLAVPLVGTIGFLGTWIVCTVVFRSARRRAEKRRRGMPRSLADRLGGAAFGLAHGALIVVLLGWLSLWIDAARSLAAPPGSAQARTEHGGSMVAGVSAAVVEIALESALPDSGGTRIAVRLAARPGETLESLQRLMEDPRVQAVQDDKLFWRYLQNDAVENALNRRSFWNIVHDDELRADFAQLGLIDQEAAEDPQAFREEAAKVLAELAPIIRELYEDPQLRRLANDPEILALLESGDAVSLLSHPEIRSVVTRVSADAQQPAH